MSIIASNFPVEGSFRCVVKDKDGNIKQDTGFIKNVVTTNGMYTLLGLTDRDSWIQSNGVPLSRTTNQVEQNILNYCVVGDGLSVPNENDIKLSNIVSFSSSVKPGSATYVLEEPTDQLHPGFVKSTNSKTFLFEGIDNKNISEVGLSSRISSIKDAYCLLTHANLVDGSGNNSTITVSKDDLFEVTYNFSVYININRTKGTFNLKKIVNGSEVNEEYEYICQPYKVRNNISSGYYIISDNGGPLFNAYPILENETSIDSSYNISSLLDGCDYKSIDPMMARVGERIPINESYQSFNMTVDKNFNRISRKATLWFYSKVNDKNIRAWDISILSNRIVLLNYMIVVKNKSTGLGIKKTDKQKWTVEHSISFSRMPK